jgi:hypothetical protein
MPNADKPVFKLSDFPKGFEPLAVVMGDRRESRPKTLGDLLAYSVSSIDLMFLAELQLSPGTLIVSDKVFVIEEENTLRDRFGGLNLLTIGSPAVNLFSRMINDQSIFRFEISEEVKVQLERQRKIILPHKFDRTALEFYIAIVNGTTKVETLPDFRTLTDTEIETFNTIRDQVVESGLTSYKALLHEFSGSAITDPIKGNAFDFARPDRHGFRNAPDKDYGLVSLAAHPYADDRCVIYVAGTHGPATAYGVHLLGTRQDLESLPYGGVFEVIIPQFIGFAHRLQRSKRTWQTKSHQLVPGFELARIPRPKQQADLRVFISLPMSAATTVRPDLPILALKRISSRDLGQSVEWVDPYSIPKTNWDDFRGRILSYFPTMDFVIHDVTDLSHGVMFEVGYSRGLDKKRVLLWDTSRARFDPHQLPAILRNGVHIDSVDFTDTQSLCSIVVDSMRATLASTPVRPSAPRSSVGPIGVMVLASPACRATVETSLRNQIAAWNKGPVVWDTPLSLADLYAGIEASEHVIVVSDPQYSEGNLALGLGSALHKRMLEIYEGDGCVMFDGLKQPWNKASLDVNVQDGLKKLFQKSLVGV